LFHAHQRGRCSQPHSAFFSIYRGSILVCELNSETHSHNNILELTHMNIITAQSCLAIKQGPSSRNIRKSGVTVVAVLPPGE